MKKNSTTYYKKLGKTNMKQWINGNVMLISEDHDELYLIIKDEISGITQDYAILPEELPRIKEVIEQYLAKKV